jgi:hypothetical protein
MPIDVLFGGETVRVEMTGRKGTVDYSGAEPVIDPKGWVLKQ